MRKGNSKKGIIFDSYIICKNEWVSRAKMGKDPDKETSGCPKEINGDQ